RLLHGGFEIVAFGAGDQVGQHFRVAGRLENGSFLLQPAADRAGVHQVAVGGDGQIPAPVVEHEGLGVDELAFAGSRIADVGDGVRPGELRQIFAVEHVLHETHAPVAGKTVRTGGA